MRKGWLAPALVVVLALTACGGGSGTDDTIAAPGPGSSTGGTGGTGGMGGGGDHMHGGAANTSCNPTGTTVSVVASGTKFATDCLAGAAGQPLTVSYENKDSMAHNIVFLESHTATEVMFRADIFQGPATKTFTAGPFKAGTYAFHCEVHPAAMSGTFVVK